MLHRYEFERRLGTGAEKARNRFKTQKSESVHFRRIAIAETLVEILKKLLQWFGRVYRPHL